MRILNKLFENITTKWSHVNIRERARVVIGIETDNDGPQPRRSSKNRNGDLSELSSTEIFKRDIYENLPIELVCF